MTTPTSDPAGDAPDADLTTDAAPAAAAGAAPESDAKRKFREALERKNARQHASAAAGGTGDSKVHSAHGPASHQKQFRRKSGG